MLAIVGMLGAAPSVHAQKKIVDPWDQNFRCLDGFRKVGGQCFKICPPGETAAAAFVDKCVKATPRAEPFVKRGFFGGCPTGYVDHPIDPKQCALPAAAHQILRRVR